VSLWVVAIVLATAVLHAGWNAVLRHGRDGVWTYAYISIGGAVFAALWLPFLPLPAFGAVAFLGASFLVHGLYGVLLIAGYRWGELGAVYPLARGSAPLLVTAGAAFFAGERLGPLPLLAIGVISFGIIALSRQSLRTATPPRAVAVALVTGGVIATYSVIDGIGSRLSGSAFSYALWLMALNGLPWLFVLAARRGGGGGTADGARAVLGGVASTVAYALVLWAMTKGALCIVSALRETSIVFAAIIGWAVLGERRSVRRLAACGVIACGIVGLAAFR
jgi:drug/metabolite transporter (DMT)-like permease